MKAWSKKEHKVLSWLLSLILGSTLLTPVPLHGAEPASGAEPAMTTCYRFVTGVVFLWGDTAKPDSWDPAAPGAAFTVSTSASLPAGAQNVSLQAYSPQSFDLDNTPNVIGRKDASYYLSQYYPYAVNSLTLSLDGQPDAAGKITYSYTMALTPTQTLYNVREKMEQPGGEQEIRDLMEYVSPTMEQFLAKDKERVFGETIEAYLYFVPYLIQYQIPASDPAIPETPSPTPVPAVTPPAIEGEAVLVLPPYSYEGHLVPARDRSSFTVDGTAYSAQRLYAEGLGSNNFSILESGAGTIHSLTDTLAELVFSRTGLFHVKLAVETEEGDHYSDTEAIQIRKTPYIEDSLGGSQKMNRRQDLDLRIATHPSYPLVEAQVTIKDPATGELLRQDYLAQDHQEGIIQTGANTDRLKMRAMTRDALASDQYYTVLTLSFLTRPAQPGAAEMRTYHYSVFARDSRGETHTVEADFTVLPDLAPQPDITLEQTFLRDKASNQAWITVEDSTVSQDGDSFVRTWEYTPEEAGSEPGNPVFAQEPELIISQPGYQPLSFGTDKQVGFLKEGVGAFQVGLTLTDRWIEPTLEEYILPGDVLTGVAVASSLVDNVAPVISRQTQKVINTSMLLIGGSPEELDRMKNAKADFLQEFLRNGIDASLQYALLGGKTPSQITDLTALASFTHSSYGVEANGSVNEAELFAVDDRNFYMTLYTWPKQDGTNGVGEYPGAPVRVIAYDPYTGAQRWAYTTMDATRFTMGHDDTGTYLYLLYSGKTILIDKATGTVAGQIDLTLGKQNFLTEHFLYTASGGNLIQVDRRTLGSRVVWAGASGARRIGNEIHFFHGGSDAISRGILDLQSGTVTRERLYGKMDHPDFTPGAYSCLGIDARGSIILWKNPGYGNDTGRGFRVYDLQNRLIFSVEKAATGAPSPAMALDERGICNHLAVMEQVQISSTCTQYVTTWNLRTGASAANNISQASNLGYPTNGLIASFETAGRSYFIYGSTWVYIMNFGLYTGQKHYTFSYDGGGSLSKSVMGPANLDVAEEFGAVSDRFAAFLLGDNTLGNAYLRTKVLAWPKTLTGELAQVLYRFAPAGAEDVTGRKHIVLYDNSNSDLTTGVEDAVRRIQETSASFLFAAGGEAGTGDPDALSADNYGSRIAALVNGVVSLVEEATRPIAEVIQGAVMEEVLGYQPALLVTVKNPAEDGSTGTTQPGILTSTRKLEPGRQYFYEYDLKRLEGVEPEGEPVAASPNTLPESTLQADFQIRKALSDQDLLPDQTYYVTKVVEEDFNDGVVDPFFLRTGGVFGGGRFGIIGASGGTRNLLRGSSCSLKFNVPEGKRALVLMDYAMYHDDHGWQQGISIDGQRYWNNRWNNEMDSTYSGSYQHPLLLTAGEHTIGISMNYYGYGTVGYYSAIDNLKVVFVDQSRPGAAEQHGGNTLTNDWIRREGSFTAPGSRISYGSQPLTYLEGSLPGLPFDTYRTDYTLTVPAGMMSKTLAYPAGSAWGTGSLGPYFSIGGKLVGMLPENNYPWKRIASGQQVYAGNLTGSNLFYSMGSYTSSGSIPRFQQFLYPQSASASADKVFFSKMIGEVRDPDGSLTATGWDRVYLENESSDGTVTLQLQLPASPGETQYLLQNLRLFYYEKGIKTYVEDLWISDLSQLTEPAQGSGWIPSDNTSLAMTTALPGAEETDSDSLSFKKGQLVSFPMFYSDYEGDSSKRSYYRYLHEPFNDGLHPDAAVQLSEDGAEVGGPGLGELLPQGGRRAEVLPTVTKVLTDPIQRFYVDGKYVLQHWQEDQTDRSGGVTASGSVAASGSLAAVDSPYDKLSNVEEVTFYIESGSLAPWITYIKTLPTKVREGAAYQLEIGMDDSEKDELRLRTEVYLKGVLIYVDNQTGIRPDLSGTYPPVITGFAPPPDPGVYQVVCTVRDAFGAGVGTHRFEVISEGRITGFVHHTVQWDLNRKHFNLSRFGEEHNQEVELKDYQVLKEPRPRGTNVFWSGEKLMLTADLAGNPLSVSAEVLGYSSFQTKLTPAGRVNAIGESIYEGSIWDGAMIGLWGRKTPEEITVRFQASYAAGQTLTFDVPIIFDSSTAYWNLHRVW